MARMTDSVVSIEGVYEFFASLLARDPQTLQRIEEASDELELRPQGFVFSLPALHRLLDPRQSLAYRDFRQLLYGSTLNRQLGTLGAEVTLFQASGKVDSSRYCLRKIPDQ